MTTKRVTASPTTIQLLLTRKCNLDCLYCGAAQFDAKEKEPELTTGEWTNLLKRLKEIQVFRLDFSGGEIFLREDIFHILETAAAYKFPKMSVTTNGTLIDGAAARKLKTLGFKELAVSLDGSPEIHNHIRRTGGNDSFARTMEGINHLVENRVIPQILFTPLKMNYKALPALVDILHPLGIKTLSFNSLHPSGRCRAIHKDIMLDCFVEAVEMREIIQEIREKYPDFKVDDPPFTYQCYPQMMAGKEDNPSPAGKRKKLKPCSAGHSSCNITASGWVIPCSELFDFRGGNIRERDILDTWRDSENFQRIRALSEISSDEIPYCRNCEYNIFCNAGCRADAHNIYGDLSAPDPFCPYWKKK
ncbi:MAG: radical SAM protein [bacterium]|nr:radical SAM protein [bacterium]